MIRRFWRWLTGAAEREESAKVAELEAARRAAYWATHDPARCAFCWNRRGDTGGQR